MKEENVKFYRCPICGNIIGLIDGDMAHVTCCGKPMELMVANSQDASVEKHVPAYEFVEDEKELEVIFPIFEELLEDSDMEVEFWKWMAI